jgi:DNA-binding PadR family transcriptional regulator
MSGSGSSLLGNWLGQVPSLQKEPPASPGPEPFAELLPVKAEPPPYQPPSHSQEVLAAPSPTTATSSEAELAKAIERINRLANGAEKSGSSTKADAKSLPTGDFIPLAPTNYREAEISDSETSALALKFLLASGDVSGRAIADQLKLQFTLIEPTLRQMKSDQLVVYRSSAPMNDYIYQLTDLGRERARREAEHCSYFGAAPVCLKDYVASVSRQTLTKQNPNLEDLKRAFSDLLVNQQMLVRLGPAVNSGKGMFLFGAPGNGKTSIAERVTKAFGEHIWIPRTLGIGGELIRLFDPSIHEEAPLTGPSIDETKIDKRWIRIRRPTVVVGGELTMSNLEINYNKTTGISEAPVQLKSNCGTLVIDDFGRQRMSVDELLNRWIVPLEKRYDYLNLASGKKVQVPFDQLVVFSTNLEPKDLVDDAFLRRIPYKIEVIDPNEDEFRQLFKIMAPKLGFEYRQGPVDYLIETHYKAKKRPYRACQPRDLLSQVRNLCNFLKAPLELSNEYFDAAVENYFAVMG